MAYFIPYDPPMSKIFPLSNALWSTILYYGSRENYKLLIKFSLKAYIVPSSLNAAKESNVANTFVIFLLEGISHLIGK